MENKFKRIYLTPNQMMKEHLTCSLNEFTTIIFGGDAQIDNEHTRLNVECTWGDLRWSILFFPSAVLYSRKIYAIVTLEDPNFEGNHKSEAMPEDAFSEMIYASKQFGDNGEAFNCQQ